MSFTHGEMTSLMQVESEVIKPGSRAQLFCVSNTVVDLDVCSQRTPNRECCPNFEGPMF